MQYKAFISYSHAADGKLAPALQSSLQRFAKPWYRLRALRVFRDATSLSANPALWPAIEQALGEAEYFLLMASPRSAQSHWVGREVDWWLTHRSADRMLVLLTDGELAWDDRARDFDWSRTTALAPLLRGRFADEPLYVDLRWAENAANLSLRHSQFRSAILDIAAPLHGRPKDELDGEDVRQHRRTRRLTGAAIAVLSLLTVATAGAAWIAVGQSRIAKSEQKRAEEARDAESRQRKQAVASAAEARRQRGIAVEKQVEAERQQRIAEEQRRIAVVQKAAAEHQARVAMANQRSLLSRTALREEAPVRALLIAAEAVRISADAGDPRVPAAEDVLRQALATLGGRPLGGHDRPIGNVAVSLDGHWAATATWGGEIRLWDLDREEEGGAPPRILAGHTKGVRDLAFTPDGRWLATASEDGTARLWDLAGTPVRSVVLRGHERQINTLAISPDGRWLATGGADQTARLWDLKAADPAAASRVLRGHTYEIERLAFSSDSRRLVTTSRDRFLLLWDLAGAEGPPLQLDGPESSVTSAALSPDGRWLAARDAKEKVLLWDLRAADVAGSARVLPGPGGFFVRFSPDSRWLTAAGGDAGIQLWDLRAAGSAAAPVPLPADLQGSRSATRLAFSPDGRWLATDGDGGSEAARLWDLRSLGPDRTACGFGT